jgi:transcriptional regulator with XRE-family HTH domain
MAKSFRNLKMKMSPESQRRTELRTKELLVEMRLDELRRARELSQERLAELLDIKQASVSKLEHRTDMYISTLRKFIEALGGNLEITVRFEDGVVKINQFSELGQADTSSGGP